MSKWRTRMKRGRPENNTAEFVLAVKFPNGERLELDGIAHKDLIQSVIADLVKTLKLERVESV